MTQSVLARENFEVIVVTAPPNAVLARISFEVIIPALTQTERWGSVHL